MADKSGIQWTHATFNPVEGCEKVSPGCKNCYAEARDKRLHRGEHWGPNSPRLPHSASYWRQPYLWNKEAAKTGRKRVFCGSLCDIFENHPDWTYPRRKVFNIIRETPNLDWLLLTKRPENILPLKGGLDWTRNVWLGATVENQDYLNSRVLSLAQTNPGVRFLSCEPLLGPLKFSDRHFDLIDWIIIGGESGGSARPFNLEWASDIVAQIDEYNNTRLDPGDKVRVFVKQLGDVPVIGNRRLPVLSHHGGDMAEFPRHLQRREFPL